MPTAQLNLRPVFEPERRPRPAPPLAPHLGGGDAFSPRSFDVGLGQITTISGSRASALIDIADEQLAHLQYPEIQIGSLVKMRTSCSNVFGLISALTAPDPSVGEDSERRRLARLELLGERPTDDDGQAGPFRRGVSHFPALYSKVYAATPEDLASVFMFPKADAVSIGTVHQDRTIPAYVRTNDLLGKHFAVLGSTGTGKSCAVTTILNRTLARHPYGHVLMLDLHNEYAKAMGDAAVVLSPENLQLPYWLMTFEEIEEIVIGGDGAVGDNESMILAEAIVNAKRLYSDRRATMSGISVDMPIPYRLSDLTRLLEEGAARLDRPKEIAPYLRLKANFENLQADPRYRFMFPGVSVRDNMARILGQLFRVPVDGRPVTIVDLSGIPSEIINVVVSVLCRMTFDFALWSDRRVPLLLVCEEAHRYAPQDSSRGFEPTKRMLARIAKEGRKYGVSLCLTSQRPSELASEIVSQCSTIFALRLSNQRDQDFVRSAISESGVGLLEFLPSLRDAEAIAIGEGVAIPMRLEFHDLPAEERPRSQMASFSTAWTAEVADDDYMYTVVERWRRRRFEDM